MNEIYLQQVNNKTLGEFIQGWAEMGELKADYKGNASNETAIREIMVM